MARKRQRQIDLSCETGPPLTTGEIARLTGLSCKTVQRDIKVGQLKAIRRSGRAYRRIEWAEAKRYVFKLLNIAAA